VRKDPSFPCIFDLPFSYKCKELGINFSHIRAKSLTVLNPLRRVDEHIMDDADLAGPLLFFFCFGTSLLFVSHSLYFILPFIAINQTVVLCSLEIPNSDTFTVSAFWVPRPFTPSSTSCPSSALTHTALLLCWVTVYYQWSA